MEEKILLIGKLIQEGIEGEAKGLKGEGLINYVIGLGYDCSERTLAREVAKLKEIERMT